MDFLNRLIKYITYEVGGVVGVTPESMGHHTYFVKCENDI